ncbi:Retinal guanylyl cyclase 1 [Sparganum proliferum]
MDTFPSPRPDNQLNLFVLTSEIHCSTDLRLSNIFYSVSQAVRSVHNLTLNKEPYITTFLENVLIKGCNLKDRGHAAALFQKIYNISDSALDRGGFSVVIGPYLGSDCDLVIDWISLAENTSQARERLFQISYYCRSASMQKHFVPAHRGMSAAADELCITGGGMLAVVSLPVRTHTLVQAATALLKGKGWQRVNIYFEISLEQNISSDLAENLAVELYLDKADFKVIHRQSVSQNMDFARLLEEKVPDGN